ncbi:MAG: hypothetical protein GX996_03245 [Firmicutes bacterium]|nr:hypothetical protein [Bacillota bacterium]
MAGSAASFALGIMLGSMIGFGLVWWMVARNPSSEPFFSRLLKIEISSARLSTRAMLYDLQRKVEELSEHIHKTNLEINELKKEMGPYEDGGYRAEMDALLAPLEKTAPAENEPRPVAGSGPLTGLERKEKIFHLFQEGHSYEDIARKLRIGLEEVELVLSLDKNLFRTIADENIKGN